MSNNEFNFMELWDYNNPSETRKKFLQLKGKFIDLNENGKYIELLTQIARTYSLEKKFVEANNILDEAKNLLTNSHTKPRIRYLLERGRTLNSSEKYELSQKHFIEAYEIAINSDEDELAVDAAHMLGIVFKGIESLEWNKRAIKFAEKSNDNKAKRWLGSLYNNTGWTYFDMNDFENAIIMFQKAENYYTEKNLKSEISIAKYSIARTYRSLKRVNEALEILLNLLIWNKENELSEDGYVYKEIGECYLNLENRKEAIKFFKKAYTILINDIWFEKSELKRLEKIINN